MRCLLICWIAILLSCGASAQSFEYADLLDPKSTLTIDISPHHSQVAIGDVARSAKVCTGPTTICIQSDALSFAIPRTLDKTTAKWTYSEREYTVEWRGRIAALGIYDDQVWRIRSAQSGTAFVFLYSPKRGLLAVQVSLPEGVRTFVSTRDVGFGAKREE